MYNFIINVEKEMNEVLEQEQLVKLREVLINNLDKLFKYDNNQDILENKIDYLNLFICAKRVEGCSEKSIRYYKSTIEKMLETIDKEINKISTEDLRKYLGDYYTNSKISKTTVDNTRRILSSFFSWLEEENYIFKSPVRRIHKIKTTKVIKATYSDENIEIIRDNCKELRDLAIVDLLNSTGMRVGELVKLNIRDINFNERECVVWGKGDKQRIVYFDAKAKIHLQEYLKSRLDNNEALFVTLLKPHKRLQISGVEIRLRELGKKLNIDKVHPHKFRRTLATKAIDKGMPIEQVQELLGHEKIDTTLQYAMVNRNNIKNSHRRYIG
ncbi:MAG: site-specific tyrosine recombinase/integron integrase [Clostridium sp.]|uniref:site-specific tyrosine recombinase/integron integrase n=1 Tax=Clostridium sp. TaxID=1506 RepID=UPI002A91E7EF|nr:site-specific tyrosine recombinase/integron integrase [Clostridium sp.]MDY6229030.1 site-specific tyrosine recombinase/integron integrase [Clostridium sp.]